MQISRIYVEIVIYYHKKQYSRSKIMSKIKKTALIGVVGASALTAGYYTFLKPSIQTTTSNQETINSLMSETSIISSFFVVVLVAPVCEEIICRGIIPTKLFEGYEKIGYVFGWLLFTMAHIPTNPPSFLIYGWMSAVLTWTAYRTKRLEMSIFLHLVINGMSILMLILLTILIKVVGIDAFQ